MKSLFARIKSFFVTVTLVVLGLALITVISLWSESTHRDNCRKLGITCEEGRIQRSSREAMAWLEKTMQYLSTKLAHLNQGEDSQPLPPTAPSDPENR